MARVLNATPLIALDAVAIDTETTGLDPGKARIVEIAAVRIGVGKVDARSALRRLVRPGRMELWIMNADGSGQRQVTSLGGANFAPFFTPDGRRLIFSSNHANPRSRNFDLYLVNLDGTGLEQVTTNPDFDGFPQFSPDGRSLVWASNRAQSKPGETNVFIARWRD